MKNFITILVLSFTASYTQAQSISGAFKVTGYFFHPTSLRALDASKTITLPVPNSLALQIAPPLKKNYYL